MDLVHEAALRPGSRVLDVGCGTGVVARLAAQEVGDDGTVVGVDVNAGMLAEARRMATAEDLPIEWHESSAESMPFPDESFDIVVCQMSVQFMTDRAKALGEMRRVAASGGRILVTLPPPNPLFDALGDALDRHAGEEAAGFVRAVFSLGRTDQVEELLREAGLRHIEVREDRKTLHLPRPETFLWQYASSTPLMGLLAGMDEKARSALEEEVTERWRPWSDNGGVTCEQSMIVATARR